MRFSDSRLEPIWDKVRTSERLSHEDGLALFESDDLLGVGRLADHVKSKREGDRVYFVINRHITPTNVCVLSCSFCGFARKPGQAGAYEHTIGHGGDGEGRDARGAHRGRPPSGLAVRLLRAD